MTPEGKAKVKIRQWIKDNMPGSWRVSPKGGIFGKTGCPDDIICWRGVFIAIEIKSLEGNPTPSQVNELNLIRQAGGVAAIVRGYDVQRLQAIKNAALTVSKT